jgi:hypothetical protein
MLVYRSSAASMTCGNMTYPLLLELIIAQLCLCLGRVGGLILLHVFRWGGSFPSTFSDLALSRGEVLLQVGLVLILLLFLCHLGTLDAQGATTTRGSVVVRRHPAIGCWVQGCK